MKHLSSFIKTLLAFSLVGGGLIGCSDDPDPIIEVKPTAELKLDAVTARTANLTLTTEHVLEYAWTVTAKADAAAPGAADLFAGLGADFAPVTKAAAADGENKILVSNLEKATHYVFYIAYSYKDAAGNIQYGKNVLSKDFDTKAEFGEPKAELVEGEIGIVDALITLKAENLVEYAWLVTSDPEAAAPAPAVLFAEGTKAAALEGDNAIELKGLEGNTAYKFFLAYTYENEEGIQYGEVLSDEFTTQPYAGMVTFVDVDFFSITVHFEVPEGKTIGWCFVDRDQYVGMQQFGTIAPSYLEQSKDKVNVVTESQTIVFDGWVLDPEFPDEKQVPLPGQALVFVACEVVEGEPDEYDRETWKVPFDYDAYYESLGGGGGVLLDKPLPTEFTPDNSLDEFFLTEYHTVGYINAKAPEHTDATVEIEELKITSRSAVFGLTPGEGVVGYGYSYYEKGAWEGLVEYLGSEEGAVCWATVNGMMGFNDGDTPASVTITNELQLGFQYVLIVIVKGNEEGTLNNVIYHEFTAKEPTKPASEVTVTPIAAPDGNDSPYTLWFNVRCASGDAMSAKYLFNTTSEFIKTLNDDKYPTTVEALFAQGNPFDATSLGEINSAEGCNVRFDGLLDDLQYRLMVSVTNDEDTEGYPDLDNEGKGWADHRTSMIPDKTPVTSSLFTDLLGDWTATAYMVKTNYTTDEKYIDTENPIVTKMTIRSTTEWGELTPEIIALYKNEEEARKWYEEFKLSAAKYDKKVKGQNRLIVDGYDFAPYGTTAFKSAWDLFHDSKYSAYDTDELFYAYGPKWYLEIGEGDKVTMPGDYTHSAPAAAWGPYTMYMLGVDMAVKNSTDAPFDVTLSEDKQTLTIEPKVIDGNTYYLTLGSVNPVYGFITTYAHVGSLTLKKGWTEASAAASKRPMQRMNPVKVANPGKPVGKHYPQTKLFGGSSKHYVQGTITQTVPSEIRAAKYTEEAAARLSSRR